MAHTVGGPGGRVIRAITLIEARWWPHHIPPTNSPGRSWEAARSSRWSNKQTIWQVNSQIGNQPLRGNLTKKALRGNLTKKESILLMLLGVQYQPSTLHIFALVFLWVQCKTSFPSLLHFWFRFLLLHSPSFSNYPQTNEWACSWRLVQRTMCSRAFSNGVLFSMQINIKSQDQ